MYLEALYPMSFFPQKKRNKVMVYRFDSHFMMSGMMHIIASIVLIISNPPKFAFWYAGSHSVKMAVSTSHIADKI